jgi:hypothetical protein
MKRFITLSLLAVAGLTMQAQTPTAKTSTVKTLAKPDACFWAALPKVTTVPTGKKTNKTTVVWPSTENNSWHENMGMITNVPTIDNIEDVFPDRWTSCEESFSPVIWQLTEENNETVLHCYLRMPADVVENFWLCSDECVILDKESGTIYRSRRTVPDCYGKVFSFKAKKGSMLDFQIVFPKLADGTKEIAIYGVPNWYMRGMNVDLATQSGHFWEDYRGQEAYDSIPQFHKPHLVSEAKNYDKDKHESWAVYDDAHLIKPVADGTYAMWCTPEATYLAEACEMNWMREYFSRGGNVMLIDQQGHQYKCKGVLNYPNDKLFWNEGVTGDHFAVVCIFEPIPLELENITIVVPEGEPFAMWGADWSGKVQGLNIKELRQNQKLFQYHPRVVVK